MIFFLLEAIITINNKQHIDGSGVARLNREAGRAGAVPPLCQRANLQETSLGKPGKAQRSDELEPGELPDRRSPSDLRAMGRGSAPCDWFTSFGCCSSDGFVCIYSTACGKARIFCSLSFLCRKRGCIYFANERTQSVLLFANVQPYALCVHRFHRCRRKMLSANGDCGCELISSDGVKT